MEDPPPDYHSDSEWKLIVGILTVICCFAMYCGKARPWGVFTGSLGDRQMQRMTPLRRAPGLQSMGGVRN